MIRRALVNGVESESILLRDRGLHYGDGVFRTLLIDRGIVLDADAQVARLRADAERIGLVAPGAELILQEVRAFCREEQRAVLKILLTRGESARGYQTGQGGGTRIMLLYPPPDFPSGYWREGVAVRLCATRLSRNPALAGVKHLNRLEQVLARAEWNDNEAAEGLMLDTAGHVVSGISSNLFFLRDSCLMSADLSQCGVAGVMRGLLLDAAPAYTRAVRIQEFSIADLLAADECFVCNSVIRIWPVTRLGDRHWPVGPVTRALQEKFAEPWLRES